MKSDGVLVIGFQLSVKKLGSGSMSKASVFSVIAMNKKPVFGV